MRIVFLSEQDLARFATEEDDGQREVRELCEEITDRVRSAKRSAGKTGRLNHRDVTSLANLIKRLAALDILTATSLLDQLTMEK